MNDTFEQFSLKANVDDDYDDYADGKKNGDFNLQCS